MRLVVALIGLGVQMTIAASRPPTQMELDYRLGSTLGSCLRAKCQIFLGTIDGVPSGPDGPVMVRVEAWLYGPISEKETVEVAWEGGHLSPAPKDGLGLAEVWSKTPILRNTRVLVMLALEGGLGARPMEPFFVTADEHETRIVRCLAEQAQQLDVTPALVHQYTASLSASPNPALAGYLAQYLQYRTASRDPDLCLQLGFEILETPNLPAIALNDILSTLGHNYHWMSETSRLSLIQRFTERIQRFVGQRQPSDLPFALAAFERIQRMAITDASVAPMSDPISRNALETAYIEQVKAKNIGRYGFVEKELGINPSIFLTEKGRKS